MPGASLNVAHKSAARSLQPSLSSGPATRAPPQTHPALAHCSAPAASAETLHGASCCGWCPCPALAACCAWRSLALLRWRTMVRAGWGGGMLIGGADRCASGLLCQPPMQPNSSRAVHSTAKRWPLTAGGILSACGRGQRRDPCAGDETVQHDCQPRQAVDPHGRRLAGELQRQVAVQ